MITDSRHMVEIDELILSEAHSLQHPDGYTFSILGREFSLGNPVPVDIILSSLMQDGQLVRRVGWNNREAGFFVQISGPDSKALSLGAQALELALESARELRWTPPDGVGATTVFDVLAAEPRWEFDDMDELRLRRTYRVILNCLPFGRSANLTTKSFTAGNPGYGTIDDASSLSGWSGTNVTLSLETIGGDTGVKATYASGRGQLEAQRLRRTSTDLGTQPYFAVDIRVAEYQSHYDTLYVDGIKVQPLAAIASPINPGWQRIFYARPAGGGSLEFRWTDYTSLATVLIGGIYSATTIPNTSVFLLVVEGSARTPATVSWNKQSNAPAILYTDPTLLSHGWIPNDPTTWNRCPAGTYMLWDGTDGITSGVSTITLNDTQTEIARILGGSIARPRGAFTLGARRDGRAGTLNWKKAGGSALSMTGMRLFRVADQDDRYVETSLTRIEGTGSGLVKVDIPSRDFPRGGVWLDDVDVTDRCSSWGIPIIAPPLTAAYVEGLTPSNLTLSYYARHKHHAVA